MPALFALSCRAMPAAPKTSPLRPRKKPSQPRSTETVAAILEAAAQVLEAGGPKAFNTNAVAERAGVSIGSFYQYFPNKAALTLALIRRETEAFRADAQGALDEPTGAAAMDRLIEAAVRQQLQRPELARLLDIEESRPEFRGELMGLQFYEPLLIAIVERADLPKQARAELAARDIVALLRGMIDAAGERGERDVGDLARRVRAAAFGYLDRAKCE